MAATSLNESKVGECEMKKHNLQKTNQIMRTDAERLKRVQIGNLSDSMCQTVVDLEGELKFENKLKYL